MTAVPLRAEPVLAATVRVAVPFPAPFEPALTSIHAAWLAAVHEQPALASTLIVIDPPPAGTAALIGVVANRQTAASCVTTTSVSLTSTVPRRDDVSLFEATRYVA